MSRLGQIAQCGIQSAKEGSGMRGVIVAKLFLSEIPLGGRIMKFVVTAQVISCRSIWHAGTALASVSTRMPFAS